MILAKNPPKKVADPNSKLAFANGQLLLVRRSLYEKIGGHQSVISEILEDVRLAERAKAAGGRLAVVDGKNIARTRMYSNAEELIEGWSKNLYLLMGGRLSAAIGWAVLSLWLGLSGPLADLHRQQKHPTR